jgi:HD-GYP domain-containing protein (c-di-GMP phosphodiesterase class II)
MDLIWKGSIKRKLMRISMLTTGVALLLTSILLISNEVMIYRQSLIERMGMMAKIIGTNSTAALMFNDKKTAEETLYALKSGKNITCAILYDRKGDVLAQYIRDLSTGNCRHHTIGPNGYHLGIDHLDILQRIHLDNESIGTLYIQSDLNELYSLILWYLFTVFIIILLSIAIAFVLMSRLQKIITKPLSEMADVMNTISGEKNYSARVAIQSQDEVGILGEEFNEMLSQIQNRDTELELHREHLQDLVTRRTEELARTNIDLQQELTERRHVEDELQLTLESLRNAVGVTIQVLVSAVEVRDPYTAGHQIRSADLARAIATDIGLCQDKIEGIRMAGSIHDIGKLSIPAEILSKPTKLTEIEFSLIKEHARSGYEMLKNVESPWPLAQIVYQHHERMNGSGYPRNLKGDEILMESRILAVADVVEAIASHRPYRPGFGIDAALEEIEKNKGILYDNAVVDTCLRLFRAKSYQLL